MLGTQFLVTFAEPTFIPLRFTLLMGVHSFILFWIFEKFWMYDITWTMHELKLLDQIYNIWYSFEITFSTF